MCRSLSKQTFASMMNSHRDHCRGHSSGWGCSGGQTGGHYSGWGCSGVQLGGHFSGLGFHGGQPGGHSSGWGCSGGQWRGSTSGWGCQGGQQGDKCHGLHAARAMWIPRLLIKIHRHKINV